MVTMKLLLVGEQASTTNPCHEWGKLIRYCFGSEMVILEMDEKVTQVMVQGCIKEGSWLTHPTALFGTEVIGKSH
jgi:hypothetical protein